MDRKTSENKKVWNKVSDLFIHASCLPSWGPFSVGEDLNLIGKIKDKVFLEIGCGSGRSIKYLINKGAKKVYGIDFSEKQIRESEKYNSKYIKDGNVKLFKLPMEKKIKIEPVDVVFSVYGIGWTQNPKKTFSNIYSYLKPGGLFVWSWDHTFFTDIGYKNGEYVVVHSYHNDKPVVLENWKERGRANITYRKTATWFKLLRDAGFYIDAYYEPEPTNLARGYDDPEKYYSIQKAKLIPSSFIFVCKK